MDGIEEDDGYSDDDLDALPVHDFHELQQDAIRSTQQPRVLEQGQRPYVSHESVVNNRPRGSGKSSVNANGNSYSHQPSSDYGDFDDEMLDGEIFDAADQPSILPHGRDTLVLDDEEPWMQDGHGELVANARLQSVHRTPVGQSRTQAQAFEYNGGQAHLAAVVAPKQSYRPDIPARLSSDAQALQAKIDELLRQNELLKQESHLAKNEALSKNGEISIVRANRAKEKQEEEKRLAAERKLRADEQAKYDAEIAKYKAELQKVTTDKAFVENDLVREAERRKGLQKASRAAGKENAQGKENAVTTPKKNEDLPYGDGFNEDEILAPSPSKLVLRSKPTTPKAGFKRKRKPTETSPVKPLQLSQTNNIFDESQPREKAANQSFEETSHVQEESKPLSTVPAFLHDDRFETTQKILDHRMSPGEKRSFEALAAFALPSKPERTLSSILLDAFSPLNTSVMPDHIAVTVGLATISLWSQCLDAAMYGPVVLLMDLVRFILIISPPGTAAYFTDELSVLAQRTADLNLIPRIRRKSPSKITSEIKTKECLEILHLMAYDCLWHKRDLERFWRCMRVDFIAMALKVDQPIDEILIALDLLRASVLENTFAMIRSAADGDQEHSEQGLLQIMSSLFIEAPRVPEGQEPYGVTEIAQLRLEAISLMEKMCETDHGGEALAKCVNVFVRLIRFMNDEIGFLYDYQEGHEYRIELINQSMRLLYHITTTYPHLINIQERLATTPGGAHKYLIVLTRLNFSDGIFYEQGIEDDVVECAQHLLENWVTPEEGEALVEAFSSARK